MYRVLIVEDEEKIARFIELELKHEGYDVEIASDGRSGLDQAESGDFNLILLDIMLPGLSGLEVLRRLRRESDVPVIMLTARDQVMDKVSGLDMGADDYITKPFQIEELLARIRSSLRKQRREEETSDVLRVGDLELDPARHLVSYQDEEIDLTAREFLLLQAFMENDEIVLSRNQLLTQVWGYDFIGETNVVDVYVRYLRQKIDDRFGVKFIHTIRGVGYSLRNPNHG